MCCGPRKLLGADDWLRFLGRNVDFRESNLSVEILRPVSFTCHRCVLKFEAVDGRFGDIYVPQVSIALGLGTTTPFHKAGVMGQVVSDGVFPAGVAALEEGEHLLQFADDSGECQTLLCG